MLRRLVLTSAAFVVALGVASPLASAAPLPPLPQLPPLLAAPDSLTITVQRSGNPAADGTFRLECDGDQGGGTHPRADRACARLEALSENGRDPFAPVPQDRMCTQQHGGPATARITGTWHGRKVDARFARTNGCEIARWENLQPVLPMARS
ncbi:subtilase-type protease inhibitor [Streptomyces somaliensis]|uniref:SSI family serine proteinase inhibitor n=1 Tax=Streptomyces somaliensis TaxID=78355 RepID=UPI0020CDBDAD|nr:SSI family serine proteinase inhibitor [Streptomyces somaliensis]MCP9945410.1 subtilase-type protease inhibitor [Streptomyces somaliensis]MCP9961390.1 subtilase-type protease inhibitor [Streptomyces somaliensis]MCP9974197.1 subtilase-type protease inhibitor [Streptomyces somaliensis]